MNNKGFTLIELLGVIILLGILVTIAVPSIGGLARTIQKKMLNEKISLIEESATLYGEDIKGSIIASEKRYKEYACKSFIVSNLVPNYLNKDNDNECLTSESTSNIGCVVDPSDKNNYLDKLEIIIYYKNKRIHSKVDVDNNLECS